MLLLLTDRMEMRWDPKVRVRLLRGCAAGVLSFVRSLRERAQFLCDWSVGSRAASTKSGKGTALG